MEESSRQPSAEGAVTCQKGEKREAPPTLQIDTGKSTNECPHAIVPKLNWLCTDTGKDLLQVVRTLPQAELDRNQIQPLKQRRNTGTTTHPPVPDTETAAPN
ncbi:hypothetical protein Bbelb_048170 [Branchiostoma belcheri]|nr:hypothetical protein Bbelb_048170 [Branchiostoma belcheri]